MNLETLLERFEIVKQFGVPNGKRWATGIYPAINNIQGPTTAYYQIASGLTFSPKVALIRRQSYPNIAQAYTVNPYPNILTLTDNMNFATSQYTHVTLSSIDPLRIQVSISLAVTDSVYPIEWIVFE